MGGAVTDLLDAAKGHAKGLIALNRRRTRWVGYCPLCDYAPAPSFSLNTTEGRFYCFKCQKGGDARDFAQALAERPHEHDWRMEPFIYRDSGQHNFHRQQVVCADPDCDERRFVVPLEERPKSEWPKYTGPVTEAAGGDA